MSGMGPPTQHQVDEAYRFAGNLCKHGLTAKEVERRLIERGWSASAAASIVSDVIEVLMQGEDPRVWLYPRKDGPPIPVKSAPKNVLRAIAYRCLGLLFIVTCWVPWYLGESRSLVPSALAMLAGG